MDDIEEYKQQVRELELNSLKLEFSQKYLDDKFDLKKELEKARESYKVMP